MLKDPHLSVRIGRFEGRAYGRFAIIAMVLAVALFTLAAFMRTGWLAWSVERALGLG